MKRFAKSAVGAALLFSVAALPAKADESVKAELQQIYKGVNALYEKAEEGNPRAAFFVASLHLNGIFLPMDTAKGHEFLEVAAEAEDPDAMYYLGLVHHHGVGDYSVDREKAAELIGKAAETGHKPAGLAQTLMDK